MNPKILIGTPIYSEKDYCLEEFIENIQRIDYDNYELIIVDNSTETEGWFFERLEWLAKQHNFKVFKVNRGGNSRQAICNAMNLIRHYAIDNKFDYLLTVESDLFPDEQALKRLLSHNQKVVGSYYLLGFREHTEKMLELRRQYKNFQISMDEYDIKMAGLQPQRACIFFIDKKASGLTGTRVVSIAETVELLHQGLVQCHGTGLGCTLIKREILMQFPFWFDSRFDNKHHDVYFYLDLQKNSIPVFVDTDFNIRHEPSNWLHVSDM